MVKTKKLGKIIALYCCAFDLCSVKQQQTMFRSVHESFREFFIYNNTSTLRKYTMQSKFHSYRALGRIFFGVSLSLS
jgi:hypothetical protein